MQRKSVLFVLAALFVGYAYFNPSHNALREATNELPMQGQAEHSAARADAGRPTEDVDTISDIAAAYAAQQRNVQVSGHGTVVKVLSDDNDGSRHQRFIVKLPGQQTVLIAHNINLAPRVDDLKVGDVIEFYGEYAWNARGGVVHWTHKDPRRSHPDGWLQHQGKIYQ